MKTAKRITSLLLAVALAFSLAASCFAGDTALTRQEAAEMLVQAADDYHRGVKTEDILKGYPDGNLDLRGTLTRAPTDTSAPSGTRYEKGRATFVCTTSTITCATTAPPPFVWALVNGRSGRAAWARGPCGDGPCGGTRASKSEWPQTRRLPAKRS